jgi:hypothetical protein
MMGCAYTQTAYFLFPVPQEPDRMGRIRRVDAQHLPNRTCAFRRFAPGQGLGTIHGPRYTSRRSLRRRESRCQDRVWPRSRVPRVGRMGRKARREAQQGAWMEGMNLGAYANRPPPQKKRK